MAGFDGAGMLCTVPRMDIHVLLVDDERLSRVVVSSLLRKCNYRVTVAESGGQALEMLQSQAPGTFDVLLTDVMMPQVDGIDLLRFVRSNEDLVDMPVIMMSASQQMETISECLRGGAEDYLVKPVTQQEVQKIWTHISKRTSLSGNAALPGDQAGQRLGNTGAIAKRLSAGAGGVAKGSSAAAGAVALNANATGGGVTQADGNADGVARTVYGGVLHPPCQVLAPGNAGAVPAAKSTLQVSSGDMHDPDEKSSSVEQQVSNKDTQQQQQQQQQQTVQGAVADMAENPGTGGSSFQAPMKARGQYILGSVQGGGQPPSAHIVADATARGAVGVAAMDTDEGQAQQQQHRVQGPGVTHASPHDHQAQQQQQVLPGTARQVVARDGQRRAAVRYSARGGGAGVRATAGGQVKEGVGGAAPPAVQHMNLRQWLSMPGRKVQPAECAWIMAEVLLLLEAAQSRTGQGTGGCLKPSNLLLHSNGQVTWASEIQAQQQQQEVRATQQHGTVGGLSDAGAGAGSRQMQQNLASLETAQQRRQRLRAATRADMEEDEDEFEVESRQQQQKSIARQDGPQHAAQRTTAQPQGAAAAPVQSPVWLGSTLTAETEAQLYCPPELATLQGFILSTPSPTGDTYQAGLLFTELLYMVVGGQAACNVDMPTLLSAARSGQLPPAITNSRGLDSMLVVTMLQPSPTQRPSVQQLQQCEIFHRTVNAARAAKAALAAGQPGQQAAQTAATGQGVTGQPQKQAQQQQSLPPLPPGANTRAQQQQQQQQQQQLLQQQDAVVPASSAGALKRVAGMDLVSNDGNFKQQLDQVVLLDFLRIMHSKKKTELAALQANLQALDSDITALQSYMSWKASTPASRAHAAPSTARHSMHTSSSQHSQHANPAQLKRQQSCAATNDQDAGRKSNQAGGSMLHDHGNATPLHGVRSQGVSTGVGSGMARSHSKAVEVNSETIALQEAAERWERLTDKHQALQELYLKRRAASSQEGAPVPDANNNADVEMHAAVPQQGVASTPAQVNAEAVGQQGPRAAVPGALPDGSNARVHAGNKRPLLASHISSFSTDLTSFSRHKELKLLSSFSQGESLSSMNMICSVAFDRDNEFFATAGVSKRVRIYELSSVLRTGAASTSAYPVLELSSRSRLSSICWSNYLKGYLAAADYEGLVALWDVTTNQELMQFEEHAKRVWAVDMCPTDLSRLASASDDAAVKLWALNQDTSIATIHCQANVCSVQWHNTNPYILACGAANCRAMVYDVRALQQPLTTISTHSKAISYVRFTPQGHLLTASTDSTIRRWDLKNVLGTAGDADVQGAHTVPKMASRTLQGTPAAAAAVPSPTRSGPPDCAMVYQGHTNERNFVGLTINDQGYIVCGSEDNTLFCYHQAFPLPALTHSFNSTGNAAHASTSRDGREQMATSGGPPAFVSSVAWSRSGTTLLAANSLGVIRVLELS